MTLGPTLFHGSTFSLPSHSVSSFSSPSPPRYTPQTVHIWQRNSGFSGLSGLSEFETWNSNSNSNFTKFQIFIVVPLESEAKPSHLGWGRGMGMASIFTDVVDVDDRRHRL